MAYGDDFKVFGPYKRQDGRQIVIVVENNGKKRTISYPKWLMELQLGRKLDPNLETVDHIDSNFDNNELSNLRLVPRDQHSADDTRRVKMVKFICAWCDKDFERSPRLIRDKAKKGKAGPFCSRTCAGKYSRMLQLKLIDKMDSQKAVDSEYYKRKYVVASSPIIFGDELIDYLCDIWE
jgi:HNH endonuclease